MNIFEKHEVFEIEVLNELKNANLLNSVVFVGGTMLRLCYDLNRYSMDIDFWFIRTVNYSDYFLKLKKKLIALYELTDAKEKLNTLLVELRSPLYPKKLKIEMRKGVVDCDYNEKIAFSQYSNIQIILRVITLEEAMKNKIKAAINRKEIRDFYDIEFLLRKGIDFSPDKEKLIMLREIALDFKEKDFKVILGSVLEAKMRKYYIDNKFDYLIKKINEELSF